MSRKYPLIACCVILFSILMATCAYRCSLQHGDSRKISDSLWIRRIDANNFYLVDRQGKKLIDYKLTKARIDKDEIIFIEFNLSRSAPPYEGRNAYRLAGGELIKANIRDDFDMTPISKFYDDLHD